ncbi:hypothetical protein QYF61_019782 [Mycteria americana]|uniref:Uncharacterized protein n=1 Tax=Mycteria americana TaxID=33587 RepID=A0AAN7MTF3_MYCAM|nr:hypothetical protein QYF61_019782 [Mycteria americana]
MKERYPFKEDVVYHPGKWTTMERGIQYLRELAMLERGPASSHVEERDNQVYWTVWIRWPGTSDPQEYKALVDAGAQCPLMPSSYTGAGPFCISGVTGGSQQLTVLEAEVSLTGNEWQKHPIVTGCGGVLPPPPLLPAQAVTISGSHPDSCIQLMLDLEDE